MRNLPLLLLGLCSLGLAQTPIQVTAQVGATSFQIVNGGSLVLQAPGTGREVLASVAVTNTSSSPIAISQLTVSGSTDITLPTAVTLPLSIAANGSFSFTIRYLPSSGLRAVAQASIGIAAGVFSFSVSGSAPDPGLSFFLNPDGALTPLASGSKLSFPATALQTQRTATFLVSNRGSAPSVLSTASVSGTGFQLLGLPALPATIAPNQDIRFSVVFTPLARGTSVGTMILTSDDRVALISLEGLGAVTDFSVSYVLQADGSSRALPSGGQLNFLTTNLNATAQATVIVQNQGNAPGSVTSVSVSGAGFQLASVPILPATIAAGSDLRFNVLFNPTQPGSFTGTLRIDLPDRSLFATLSGSTGNGDLAVAYTLQTDGNVRPLLNGGLMSFGPTSLNSTAQATVSISNQGTGIGRVVAVTLTGNGFQLQNLPLLPANVSTTADFRFNVLFTPRQTGIFVGTLRIDFPDRSVVASIDGSTSSGDFNFSYVDADNNTHALSNGAAIAFLPTAVNTTGQASLVITNNGPGSGVITGVAVSGSAFKLSGVPAFPLVVDTTATGRTVRIGIQFNPTQLGTFNGSIRVDYDNRSFNAPLVGSTAAPDFSISYQDPTSNNNTTVNNRDSVLLPSTQVNQSNAVSITITNSGQGTGFLNRVTLTSPSGNVLQLTGLPPLPLAIPATRATSFNVRFSPLEQQRYSGTLQIELTNQTITLFLDASGLGPTFVYERADVVPSVNVQPDQTISFGEVALNQNATVTLLVRNAGSSDGQISAITLAGTGFQLVDVPFTPLILKVNDVQRISVRFAPTQPGSFTGRLRIGNDSFTLDGVGAGSRLTYSFLTAGTPTNLDENGVVVMTPTRVGERSQVEFVVQNQGNRSIVISSVSFTTATAVFQLADLTPLPVSLAADQTLRFTVRFLPNDTTTASATLRVNNSPFTVSGTGLQPLPLPDFRYQGTAGGVQEPLQQPSIGLALASPYPLPLRGTLTLSFVSEVFSSNTAVQFSSGGRTANFTIPANSTQAVFDSGSNIVRLQTGSVAGNIVITPAFATQGGLDLTPANPAKVTYTVNRSVPKLLEGSISARALSAVAITFTGYTTTRALKQMDVQLTPRPGQSFSNNKLTVNLESTSVLWFQSAAADSFGGLFTISLPLAFQGGSTTDDLVGKIQTIGITVTNDLGVSNSLSINVP